MNKEQRIKSKDFSVVCFIGNSKTLLRVDLDKVFFKGINRQNSSFVDFFFDRNLTIRRSINDFFGRFFRLVFPFFLFQSAAHKALYSCLVVSLCFVILQFL